MCGEKKDRGERKLWEESGVENLNDLPVFYDSYLDFNRFLMVAQNRIVSFMGSSNTIPVSAS